MNIASASLLTPRNFNEVPPSCYEYMCTTDVRIESPVHLSLDTSVATATGLQVERPTNNGSVPSSACADRLRGPFTQCKATQGANLTTLVHMWHA